MSKPMMEIEPAILDAEAERIELAFAGLMELPSPSRRWGLPAPEQTVEELLAVTNDAIPMEALRLADWSGFDDGDETSNGQLPDRTEQE